MDVDHEAASVSSRFQKLGIAIPEVSARSAHNVNVYEAIARYRIEVVCTPSQDPGGGNPQRSAALRYRGVCLRKQRSR